MLMVYPLPLKITKYYEPIARNHCTSYRSVGKHSSLGGHRGLTGLILWQKSNSYWKVIESENTMAPGSYVYAVYNDKS